jgi:hypothetical protein
MAIFIIFEMVIVKIRIFIVNTEERLAKLNYQLGDYGSDSETNCKTMLRDINPVKLLPGVEV